MPTTSYDIGRGIKVAMATFVALLLVLYLAVYIGHKPSADSTQIRIYTTAWCPYCAQLRTRLDAQQIPYQEYDVEQSLWGMGGYLLLGGQSVPVIAAGSTVIHGYQIEPLQRALADLGYAFTANSAERSLLFPSSRNNSAPLLLQ